MKYFFQKKKMTALRGLVAARSSHQFWYSKSNRLTDSAFSSLASSFQYFPFINVYCWHEMCMKSLLFWRRKIYSVESREKRPYVTFRLQKKAFMSCLFKLTESLQSENFISYWPKKCIVKALLRKNGWIWN